MLRHVVTGKPRRPSITVSDNSPYEDRSVTLTCDSRTNTVPRNHTLTLTYVWTIDGVNNPPDPRYMYSSTGNTLTISNIVRSDSTKPITCVAREIVDNGYTSDSSITTQLDVQCMYVTLHVNG